jgi:hypothetical protein
MTKNKNTLKAERMVVCSAGVAVKSYPWKILPEERGKIFLGIFYSRYIYPRLSLFLGKNILG